MKGAPRLAIRSHETAASICCWSWPIRSAAGCAISCSTTVTTMPMPIASHVACIPNRTASSRRPAPNSRAAEPVVP